MQTRSGVIDWVPRADGGFDVFYSHKFHSKQFRLWRGKVQPARNASGLATGTYGWVVSGHAFDDMVFFATLDEAKTHMEAIAALEAD